LFNSIVEALSLHLVVFAVRFVVHLPELPLLAGLGRFGVTLALIALAED
jgi:hypothetical protein